MRVITARAESEIHFSQQLQSNFKIDIKNTVGASHRKSIGSLRPLKFFRPGVSGHGFEISHDFALYILTSGKKIAEKLDLLRKPLHFLIKMVNRWYWTRPGEDKHESSSC